MLSKPIDIYDRETEWADLAEFVTSQLPGLRIAVVYGRRRQGKSYLLRRLAEASGGLYHLATEQTEAISVRRFADSLTTWLELPVGALSFDGWEAALNSACGLLTQRMEATNNSSGPPLLILDEFPYLTHETPGLPSIVQALYDALGPGSGSNPTPIRLILCGSAISVMSDLLSGTKALRGRAALELKVKPFGYRDARGYWGIENVMTAFTHNALLGGTPGYRELVPNPAVPEDPTQLGTWVARNVLRPAVPLFDEANRIIREDPRIRDTAVYGSVMATIAAGKNSPTKIGGLLGRPSSSLSYQLGMLESAGFVERRQDLLLDRRPTITIADPMVRFHHLVIDSNLPRLEAGHAQQVWDSRQHTIGSKIYGPHFEALAREWLVGFGPDDIGVEGGVTGQATVACREHKTSHKIDVFALEPGARPRTAGAPIAFLGEAKSRDRRPGKAELFRLQHIRDLLSAAGHDTTRTLLGLFSSSGFTSDVVDETTKLGERIVLIDLDNIYGDNAPKMN